MTSHENTLPGAAALDGVRPSGCGRDRLLRVLVVEDSRLNALALSHLLAGCSCEPHCAADGPEALERLRRSAYDLVLMDLDLPGMDGMEAARAIRSGEAGPAARDVPIVAIAARATALERARCLRAGMDGFVPRPFARETLGETIRRVLERPEDSRG
ncbi:MAG: response regulator [Thermodesulfobacteriota bacterium]